MLKDYIYLDKELLNSTAAQLDDGLIVKISSTNTSSETNTTSETKGSNSKANIKVPAVLDLGGQVSVGNGAALGLTTGQSEIIDNVFHDNLVDNIISNHSNIFNSDIKSAKPGDFVDFTEKFEIYDFDMLQAISSENIIEKLYADASSLEIDELKANISENSTMSKSEINKQISEKKLESSYIKKQVKNLIVNINNFSRLSTALFPNTVLFKTDSSQIYAEKSNLRINPSLFSIFSNSDRKIRIVGIVLEIDKDSDDTPNFESENINKIPKQFLNLLLSSFNISRPTDRLIKPIAIFFEQNQSVD